MLETMLQVCYKARSRARYLGYYMDRTLGSVFVRGFGARW